VLAHAQGQTHVDVCCLQLEYLDAHAELLIRNNGGLDGRKWLGDQGALHVMRQRVFVYGRIACATPENQALGWDQALGCAQSGPLQK
jgi:hypothetical protein